MLENRNEDIRGLYSLDEPKLLGEDTADMEVLCDDWTDEEILSLLDDTMPNLNVVGFELSESTALRVTVAPIECSAFDIEGELELSIWTGSGFLTGLTKSQLGLYLEVGKHLGD